MKFFKLLVLCALVGCEGLSAAAGAAVEIRRPRRLPALKISHTAAEQGRVPTPRPRLRFSWMNEREMRYAAIRREEAASEVRLRGAEEAYKNSELYRRRLAHGKAIKYDALDFASMTRSDLHKFAGMRGQAAYDALREWVTSCWDDNEDFVVDELNRQDSLGMTPLYIAVCSNSLRKVRLMVEHGASVTVECGKDGKRIKGGWTPLDALVVRLCVAAEVCDEVFGSELIQDMALDSSIKDLVSNVLVLFLAQAMIEEAGLEFAVEKAKTDKAKACLVRVNLLMALEAEEDPGDSHSVIEVTPAEAATPVEDGESATGDVN